MSLSDLITGTASQKPWLNITANSMNANSMTATTTTMTDLNILGNITSPALVSNGADLDLNGNVDLSGNLLVESLTANSAVYADLNKKLTSSVLNNGQVLVGSTGAVPLAANLTGTANRVSVTNGANSITLSAPQDLALTSNVTFNSSTLSNLSAFSALVADATKKVASVSLNNGQLLIGKTGDAPLAANISGTTNQVTVTNGTNTITLSTPQDIASTSDVNFNSATLNSTGNFALNVQGNSNPVKINNPSGIADLLNYITIHNGGVLVGQHQYTGATSTNTGLALFNGNGDVVYKQATGAVTDKSLLTNSNTLDDGTGNMSASGNISTLTGKGHLWAPGSSSGATPRTVNEKTGLASFTEAVGIAANASNAYVINNSAVGSSCLVSLEISGAAAGSFPYLESVVIVASTSITINVHNSSAAVATGALTIVAKFLSFN